MSNWEDCCFFNGKLLIFAQISILLFFFLLSVYSLTQSLTKSLTHYLCTENAEARAEAYQFTFQALKYSGCKGRRAVQPIAAYISIYKLNLV